MTVKVTMKMGDDVHIISEDEAEVLFGKDGVGLEQTMQAKGMLMGAFSMVDMNPRYKGKRIEVIMEFDDGEYIVVGRREKESPTDGI